MSVFGTRPEAIKMAPVVRALESDPGSFVLRVAVTAQHREMLDQVLEWFEIQPDYDLDIMQPGQSLSDVIVRALTGLEGVLTKDRPDLILVHGDTSTTFAAALAAYYQRIPVGHVEAGLRTNDKYQPFPEEINRRLTGVLADLHFAPTPLAKNNLLAENAPPESIFVTGNTVVDALLETVNKSYTFTDQGLADLIRQGRRILLVTAHRRENHGAPLEQICLALRDLAGSYPDVAVVYPVHRNPQVVQVANAILSGHDRVFLIDPLPYEAMAHLMKMAYLVLTDSGGIQEEAPGLGKPVLVL
ncbi:MAG: non-hydrolyzing UDP-N-acetylglucosamine 2-epimerase, partial [Syntrophothermus sp.]